MERSYDEIAKSSIIAKHRRSSSQLLHYLSWTLNRPWIMIFDSLQHQSALYLASQHRLSQGLNGRLIFTVEDEPCLGILQPLDRIRVPQPCWLETLGDEQNLQMRILEALQKTRSDQGHDLEFLPRGELYRLVNQDTVVEAISRQTPYFGTSEMIQGWARAVCSEIKVVHRGKEGIKIFRKIFALLVIAELTSSLPALIDEDVSDFDLPLTLIKPQGTKRLSHKDPLGGPENYLLRCFRNPQWSPMKVRNFADYQWKMIAPFFAQDKDGDIKHYVLQDQHILPFLLPGDEEDNTDRTGGFGKVPWFTSIKIITVFPIRSCVTGASPSNSSYTPAIGTPSRERSPS